MFSKPVLGFRIPNFQYSCSLQLKSNSKILVIEQEFQQSYFQSVCISSDDITLASGSYDKSIRLWDVKTGKEIQSSVKSYKDILTQFITPLFYNNPLPKISTNITRVLISQTPIFQAQGALVIQGEFINYQGVDLRSLLKSKGSFILDKQVELQQK